MLGASHNPWFRLNPSFRFALLVVEETVNSKKWVKNPLTIFFEGCRK